MTNPTVSVLIRPRWTVEAESLRQALRPPCSVLAVEESDRSATALVLALPRHPPSAPELAALVTGSDLPIVMLVDLVDPWTIALSRSLGKPTLVSWRSPLHEVVSAIHTAETRAHYRRPPVDALHNLSARERDVMSLVAMGQQDTEIATCLGISIHTVRSHVRSALVKLDVPHRHAAAAVVRASPLMNRGPATSPGSRPRQIAGA